MDRRGSWIEEPGGPSRNPPMTSRELNFAFRLIGPAETGEGGGLQDMGGVSGRRGWEGFAGLEGEHQP